MTSRYGIDEDWSRLTPAQLLAAEKTWACGYVSEDVSGKNITAAEVRAYHAAGVAVLLVYEYSITAVQGGAAKGHHDAAIAINGARALGYPAGCAIAFAIDENTSSTPAVIDGYCRAFTADVRAAGWRSMVYGGLATVKRCADLGLTDLTWQTYAWSGSPTVWDGRAAIRQYQNGAQIAGKYVDLDVALVDDFGAWQPNGDVMTPEEHEWLRQVWVVLGSAYAKSSAAGESPVRDIGDQVWDATTALAGLKAQITALAAPPVVTLTDAQVTALGQQLGTELGGTIDKILARLTAAGKAAAGEA